MKKMLEKLLAKTCFFIKSAIYYKFTSTSEIFKEGYELIKIFLEIRWEASPNNFHIAFASKTVSHHKHQEQKRRAF